MHHAACRLHPCFCCCGCSSRAPCSVSLSLPPPCACCCRVDVLPGVVRVNAAGGFQQAAQEAGFPQLVAKAKSQGVAVMGVVQSRGMSGAMWYPCEQLAEQGLITIVCSNSPGYVAYAPGNATRVFGTNPMAFGWPRANGHPPYVWDQAASVIARGDIQVRCWPGPKRGRACTCFSTCTCTCTWHQTHRACAAGSVGSRFTTHPCSTLVTSISNRAPSLPAVCAADCAAG